MSGVAHTELAPDLATAAVLVQRIGAPFALIADPMGQGPAEEFCKKLAAFSALDRILLVSDGLDERFALAQGLRWLALSSTSREELTTQLQALINRAVVGAING